MNLDLQALLILLVIGAIAGWLAGTLVKGYGFGLIGNIVVGVIGAYIGAWLLPQIGFGISGLLGSIISATIGAIVLLLLIGLVRKVA
ncbi:MAG TPA: GlsB/YeaQ/YmgE family stress response membrane protein [Hyphomicrobium sp.]|nr:GlsB/YeaQ/YmgE family stress response membrane protein [Hyphomicrobium sp.]